MGEYIHSGSGTQHPLIINADGSINTVSASAAAGSQSWIQNTVSVTPSGAFNVVVSGLDVSIGSVVLQLEDVYVRSGANIIGSFYSLEVVPTDITKYNPTTVIVYSGTAVGSIYELTSIGSSLKVLSYNAAGDVINISNWSVV